MTHATSIGGTARDWPNRSTYRDSSGWPTASASAPTADTAPASPYRWVVDDTSRTRAIPPIEIGSRATNAAAENAGPPGTRSSAAYGFGTATNLAG